MLVDTSVWSLALRKKGPADHPDVTRLAQLLRDGEDVYLTGTILQEILQAFRSESVFRRVARYLSETSTKLDTVLRKPGDHLIYDKIGYAGRPLRSVLLFQILYTAG